MDNNYRLHTVRWWTCKECERKLILVLQSSKIEWAKKTNIQYGLNITYDKILSQKNNITYDKYEQ